MNLDDYRVVFSVSSLIVILISTFPTLALFVSVSNEKEPFSGLWVLGPNRMIEDYPLDVHVNVSYNIFVGGDNHLGFSSYYLVYVKLRNQTQPLPDTTVSEPSLLTPLSEFRFFVKDGEAWEKAVTYRILDASYDNNSIYLSNISINEASIPINVWARTSSEHPGFYCQLFFELWLYNIQLQSFQFHNRFVGIWLNVTI